MSTSSQMFLHAILFLFFFELISDFIETVYSFSLRSQGVTGEIVGMLFLFSPLFLLLLKEGAAKATLIITGTGIIICRIAETLLLGLAKMIFAGLGVGCFLILFPLLLRGFNNEENESGWPTLGASLAIGLSLSILFRTLGSGIDITSDRWYQTIGWILAMIAGIQLVNSFIHKNVLSESKAINQTNFSNTPNGPTDTTWRLAGLFIGITSVFILAYFAFSSPYVIARWTGVGYGFILIILMSVLSSFAIFIAKTRTLTYLNPKIILIWNVVFVISLVLTLCLHQVHFPTDANAYPISEPPVSLLHHVPLVFMIILCPILIIDFMLFAKQVIASRPTVRVLGKSCALCSVYLLVMIVAQIFTTVYDYIPIIGPFFRDRLWLVFLIAGILLTFPVLLVSKNTYTVKASSHVACFTEAVIFLSVFTIFGFFITSPKPVYQPDDKSTIKILTYNIQQGYNEFGQKNFHGQLELIRQIDADIIGLQESDPARIAGGNSDVVRYFADKPDMYSYYGPKTVVGTFGIALLSKYPIKHPRTFYMYSVGEQTAAIEAQIEIGEETYNLFVTHLGNGGPIIQQKQILDNLKDKENIILLGDFNFSPDSDQYKLTTNFLKDAWPAKWPQGVNNHGVNPFDRIDHIFTSSDVVVTDAEYFIGSQSDHPAMVVEIEK